MLANKTANVALLATPGIDISNAIDAMMNLKNKSYAIQLYSKYDLDTIVYNISQIPNGIFKECDELDTFLRIIDYTLQYIHYSNQSDEYKFRHINIILNALCGVLNNNRFHNNTKLTVLLIMKEFIKDKLWSHITNYVITVNTNHPQHYEKHYPGIIESYVDDKRIFVFNTMQIDDIPHELKVNGNMNYTLCGSLRDFVTAIEIILNYYNIRLSKRDIMYMVDLLDISNEIYLNNYIL